MFKRETCLALSFNIPKPMHDYRLQLFGFPAIKDIQDLANCVHLSTARLYRLSKYNNKFYTKFMLPKTDTTFREIFAPCKEIKSVQAWILRNILEKIQISDFTTGFIKSINICHNVERHRNNKYFLCLDIDDFFPSILYGKVYNVFRTIGYNPHVSHILTSLCTCEGKLPQGGVTSPALSNIICIRMDKRIAGYVGKRNIAYTRYADDMTFSSMSDRRLVCIKKIVCRIIKEEGFKLNERKTRFLGPNRQRKITGLVINDNSFGIGRQCMRTLRSKIHRLLTLPLSTETQKENPHIEGWLAFVKNVDPARYHKLEEYLQTLIKKQTIGK